jgi:tetratricopeptide (TPR) repeat protein
VPADDEAYALLVDIRGLDLIPWLDEVYARDRFEERPLIWKAHLLLKANRLEEAEATVRKALQVDPTDGEQKKGDRVRGYAVLAEILKAEGKAEDAAFFERVVKSVRIAEKGDTFTELGLLSRSRDLYGQAASEFADAYCVQWRLGERLYALGDVEGAKEHYRIAFERMPEQFGQVASFCFGCEGVFARRESRSVAETVFMHLAETMPDKPQVHFMLGQLRQAQGREAEAYKHYKDAVAKDPDYLDAWKKIRELQNDLFLPRAEMDPVVLRMFRLDPLNRHGSGDLRDVADMKKMWETVASVGKFSLATPKSLLALPESAKFIRELGQQNGLEMPEMTTMGMPGMPFEALELNPETALARHNVVQQILRIGGGSQYYL